MRTIIIATALSFLCLFSQAQNVGIGTTTPQVRLHVLKGVQTVAPNAISTMAVQSDGKTFLQILSNGVSDQNGIYFGHTTQPISAGIVFNYSGSRELAFFTNASAPSFILNNQGNVGIGTLSPNAPLQFATSNQKRKIVLFETANNDNQFFGFGVFAGELRYQTGVATDDHVFYSAASSTASNELMRIKGNGNVGIGTSAPNAQLQFSNATANRKIVFYEAANNDHQFNGFGLNPGVLRYQVNNTSDDHVFYAGTSATTSNELLRIKGNGNVGIGTSTPTYKLHVGNSNNSLRIEGPALSGGIALSIGGVGAIQIDKPGMAGGRFIVKDNGDVGVGTSAPSSTLDVNGAMAMKVNYRTGNSGPVPLDNTGTIWIFGSNISANIVLPDPFSCPNRRYTIANRNNFGLTVTNYYNLSGGLVATIPAFSSIELVSGGANWEQIK